jgi:hypothetical protein
MGPSEALPVPMGLPVMRSTTARIAFLASLTPVKVAAEFRHVAAPLAIAGMAGSARQRSKPDRMIPIG